MRSFFVLSEREKENPTTHPKSYKDNARGQRKTARAKKDKREKAGQKACKETKTNAKK